MDTFSKLDFVEDLQNEVIMKMFVYLHKSYNPIKTTREWLPQKKRHGISMTNCPVKHYSKAIILDSLKSTIKNCKGRQKMYVSRWEEYIETIEKL